MPITLFKTTDENDFRQATALVDREYRQSRYILPNEPPLPDIRDTYPETVVFSAKNSQGVLCGTIALIREHAHTLPFDTVFSQELQPLRERGLRFAEIGRLAADTTLVDPTQARTLLPILYTAVLSYAFFLKLDALIITIGPKHDSFYRQFGFQVLGEEKVHPSLRNTNVLGKILFLQDVDRRYFRFLPVDPTTIVLSQAFQNGQEPLLFA